jgi:hypothetical protein
MAWLVNLWRTEPTRIIGFATAAVAFAVAFGVQLTTQQQTAILGLVSALLIVLGAEVTRSQVDSPQTVTDKVSGAYGAGQADAIEHAAVLATFQHEQATKTTPRYDDPEPK